MIGNVSRLQTFLECRQKDKYLWEDKLLPNRTPTPLLTGGAFAKGQEVFFKTGNLDESLVELEKEYRDRIGQMPFVLPEEQLVYEHEIAMDRMAMQCWAKHYQSYGFQVLYPEVKFFIPLKGTKHHCYWMHKLLHGSEDPAILQTFVCKDDRCYIEHHVKGRCDGIIQRQGLILLLETKTAAATGQPWMDQWYMDLQLTTYAWGISKALGIKINGILMNVVKKPNRNYKGSLESFYANDPFEQELFLRTDEDIERVERELVMMFDDRERAHRDNLIYMSPRRATCVAYNKRCYFFDLCQRHGEHFDGEFMQKGLDYVEEEYYRLAGLDFPQQQAAYATTEEESNG